MYFLFSDSDLSVFLLFLLVCSATLFFESLDGSDPLNEGRMAEVVC